MGWGSYTTCWEADGHCRPGSLAHDRPILWNFYLQPSMTARHWVARHWACTQVNTAETGRTCCELTVQLVNTQALRRDVASNHTAGLISLLILFCRAAQPSTARLYHFRYRVLGFCGRLATRISSQAPRRVVRRRPERPAVQVKLRLRDLRAPRPSFWRAQCRVGDADR